MGTKNYQKLIIAVYKAFKKLNQNCVKIQKKIKIKKIKIKIKKNYEKKIS